jgi:hypothetical protein
MKRSEVNTIRKAGRTEYPSNLQREGKESASGATSKD